MRRTCEAKDAKAAKARARGFSLLELVIVLAITFVVSAMAIPRMAVAIADYKLRTAASQFANILQRARAEAVRRNATVRVDTQIQNGLQMVWIEVPPFNGVRDAQEAMMLMPDQVTIQTAGFPGDATAGQNPASYPVMPIAAPIAGQFNSRGQPCADLAGITGAVTCRNTSMANAAQGFVYYIRGDRPFGVTGWGSVLVTPAGRIRAMTYSNNKYQ